MKYKRVRFFILFCGFAWVVFPLNASDYVSRSEFEQLLARVSMLEMTLGALEVDVGKELNSSSNTVITEMNSGKSSILDRVIDVIKIREDNVNHPWMDGELWSALKPGLSPDDVELILGPLFTNGLIRYSPTRGSVLPRVIL
jgi:hypothetical protein